MTIESHFIKTAAKGESMFTDKGDNNIQALASYHKKKVVTERITGIDKATNTKITQLLKITIL
jgi:hypothetical protein